MMVTSIRALPKIKLVFNVVNDNLGQMIEEFGKQLSDKVRLV